MGYITPRNTPFKCRWNNPNHWSIHFLSGTSKYQPPRVGELAGFLVAMAQQELGSFTQHFSTFGIGSCLKRLPLVVEFFFLGGDEILPSYVGIISQTMTRTPMKQPGFNGKYPMDFFVAHIPQYKECRPDSNELGNINHRYQWEPGMNKHKTLSV